MKFHNYSTSPEKGKTFVSTLSEQGSTKPLVNSNSLKTASLSKQQQSQPIVNLKNKITPEQLLQLQQQLREHQSQPAKRPKLDIQTEVAEGSDEVDTSATESETEMDQRGTVYEEVVVTHSTTQRLDASTLKARAGAGGTTTNTILMSDDGDYGSDDRPDRRKVKRKIVSKTNTTNTSTKAKLQMVHEFPTLFLGLRRNRIFLVNSLAQSFELNQRDIILTLRKIKLNEHHARLASVFGLSDNEVEILFRSSVPKIADCLRNFIVWPDDITMKLNVPINLRQHFNKIHLILNYLVIKVRQNAVKHFSEAQSETSYCELDQCHKLKYLIASTLDGCVCFVSRGFGIQTDDDAVLSQSGFLTKFKTNTNLIAGKNFHNFEDRLMNGSEHDQENNNGDSDLERTLGDNNFEDIVSEKISKSRTFKLKNYIESVLESFQAHMILSPMACVDGKSLELLDDIVVIVGALINLQKQEVD